MDDRYMAGDDMKSSDSNGDDATYKRMYDMGKELMDMAVSCGYSPDDSPEEDSEPVDSSSEDAAEPSAGGGDRVGMALRMMGK